MAVDINNLRQDILGSARTILSSRNHSPDNKAFHRARYKLYDIAARDICRTKAQKLIRDPEVREAANRIFPISCEAGIKEECAIAKTLLEQSSLTFGHIYRNYYGKIYEALMADEMVFLESRQGLFMEKAHVVYIGGGALPIPAMLMAQRIGCRVTIVDPDAPSCDLARRLIERIGLDHLITVEQVAGQEYDYSTCDIAYMANWIPGKNAIFRRLGEFPGLKYCVFRSAPEQSLSFVINDKVELCDVCDHGFTLDYETKKRPDLSLVSLIFSPETQDCALHTRPRKRKSRVVEAMTDLIGNTPMLRLDPQKTGLKNIDLYAKLENMNPFGSIKDRTAWGMLKPHIEDIRNKKKTVLELSSGNAARGLQAVASIYGARLETVSNRIRVEEMRNALLMQGTKVTTMPEADPEDAYSALNIVDRKASENPDRYFYTDQYRNPNNDGTHYSHTGREIIEDLGAVDYFAGAVGTAGSTVGISRRLREHNPELEVIGVISEKEDYIPGIRHKDEIFDVGPFDEDLYDHIAAISTDAAIDGILELTRLYGVMPGPSTGATYQAVLSYLKDIDKTLESRKKAVFIVCDRMEMYFSWLAARRPDLFDI